MAKELENVEFYRDPVTRRFDFTREAAYSHHVYDFKAARQAKEAAEHRAKVSAQLAATPCNSDKLAAEFAKYGTN